MSRYIGKKTKSVEILVPNGKKIKGIITEIKNSDLYADSLNIKIECPEYTAWSEDGQRKFVKFAYFSFPMNWSSKNKAGKLYQALTGKLPIGDIDWEDLLLNREVGVIFKDDLDASTGESKGQRILSLTSMDGDSKAAGTKGNPPPGLFKKDGSELAEETPF